MEKKTSAIDRLEHAFNKAEQHLGIEKLLDPEGNSHTHTPPYTHAHTHTMLIAARSMEEYSR